MGMVSVNQKLSASYYADMIWAILHDMCKHFNEYMSVDNFQSARFGMIWSHTYLRGFAQKMRAPQQINLITIPDEWRDAISNNRQYRRDLPLQREGGGRGEAE